MEQTVLMIFLTLLTTATALLVGAMMVRHLWKPSIGR